MRALRFHTKRDIRLEEMAAPSHVAPGQVLIRPILCGICGTDLHEYTDGPIVTPSAPHSFTGAMLPQILGHEFSAVVMSVGNGVTNVAPGDRVSIQPQISPRDDFYGRRGLYHLSDRVACVGLSWDWGGLAEFALVQDYNVHRVPDTVSDAEAAMVEPAAVAIHACDRAEIRSGSSVLITGAGPIGALAALAAKAAGAATIIVSDPHPKRLRRIKLVVPDALVLDPRVDDVIAAAARASEDGVGLDAAIECAGAGPALQTCIGAVRRQGVVVQVGLHTAAVAVDMSVLTIKDIRLLGSYCYPVQIWPRVMQMIASGMLPVNRIVTDTIALDDAVTLGFERLIDPMEDQLKILVHLGEEV